MKKNKSIKKHSIFRAVFVPMFSIMVLQAVCFYCVAVYGGVKQSLDQNAVQILSGQLVNHKNQIEGLFNNKWSAMDYAQKKLSKLYERYTAEYGDKPLCQSQENRVRFIDESSSLIIETLRQTDTNGVFLIVNDKSEYLPFSQTEEKTGICIRDLDQQSTYNGKEDLLLERAPSSLIDKTGVALDSWWESKYTFASEEAGDYFYYPLNAAFKNHNIEGEDVAYISPAHNVSKNDTRVISYSIPLIDETGYPYAVLGIELSEKYLSSILPSDDVDNSSCYILAMGKDNTNEYMPIAARGVMFDRCFSKNESFAVTKCTDIGGFEYIGRSGAKLYGEKKKIRVYNNNNPFESNSLVLMTFVDEDVMFEYSSSIQITLMWVSLLSLLIGLIVMLFISQKFAQPITALANEVKQMEPNQEYELERIGIAEIDQLVDNIENLNHDIIDNMAKTEFFSRMSHDMRTPMNAIICFSSDELLDDATEKQKDEYLRQIHNSGEYLHGLINEVLDMTKIQSSKTMLHITPEKAARLFESSVDMIGRLAEKDKVKFVHKTNVDEKLTIMADKQRLNQIVMNLLSNAVKFTYPDGNVVFTADFDMVSEKVVHTHICVEDSGIGISDEFMKKIYVPFEQENHGKEGTGLGLSIAAKLVDLMGGTIECHSELGIGTKFDVNIDFSICQQVIDGGTSEKIKQKHEKEISEILKGKNILLCEDHPVNTQIATKLLELKEITVTVAENGRIGVNRFAESSINEFDAVLMDICMPEMTGLEASRAIRSLNRLDAADVPIIAMTANAFAEDVKESISAGMNAHLAKPIEPDKLYSVLAKYIDIRKSKQNK